MLVVEDYGTQTSSITISQICPHFGLVACIPSLVRVPEKYHDPMRKICAADLKKVLLRVFFEVS